MDELSVWVLSSEDDGFTVHHRMDSSFECHKEAIRSGFRVLKMLSIDRALDDPMYSMRNYSIDILGIKTEGMLLECAGVGWACFVPGARHEKNIVTVYSKLTGNLVIPSKEIPEA